MNILGIVFAIVTAVLPAALPAAAATQPGGCTLKITGGLEQTFACTAELQNLNGWILIVGGKSSLPYDFGGTLTFEGDPKVGTVYTLGDLGNVSQMVRDKHDKEGNSWSASASKKPSLGGDRKIPRPVGSLTLKLTAIGPAAPAVHGTLTATLKPDTFNKNTKDVVLTFEF
jgi:hypothetical protein